jgi:tRNA(His) guanylyltransferase
VHKGLTPQEADKRLKGTFSKDKHEILFSECGNINYNNCDEIFKRGSILIRVKDEKIPKVKLSKEAI